jgi:DNA topoisomerase-1
MTGSNVRVLAEAEGRALVDALWQNLPWKVSAVEEKPGVERPAPPFTTSDAHAGSQPQARVLDRAHDAGGAAALPGRPHLLHRTDSTTLSEKALGESASAIRKMFGDDYYDGPSRYATKVQNARRPQRGDSAVEFQQHTRSLEGTLDRTTCASTSLFGSGRWPRKW